MTVSENKRQQAAQQTAIDETLLGKTGSEEVAQAVARPVQRRRPAVVVDAEEVAEVATKKEQVAVNPAELEDLATLPTDPVFDVPGLDDDLQPSNTAEEYEDTDTRVPKAEIEAARAAARAAKEAREQREATQEADAKADLERRREAIRIQEEQALAEIQAAEQKFAQETGVDVTPPAEEPAVRQDAQASLPRRRPRTTEPAETAKVAEPSMEIRGMAVEGARTSAPASEPQQRSRGQRRPLVSRDLVQRLTALNHLDANSVELQLRSIREEIESWENSSGVIRDTKLLNLALALAPILEG